MKWIVAKPIDKKQQNLLAEYTPLIAQLLVNRGIRDTQTARKFFSSKLTDLAEADLLHDMDKAVTAIKLALKNKQKIFIYGDYDVDGICAVSILFDFLFRQLKCDVLPYIPNRFDEGYGLSETGLEQIISQNGKLVITVDCGIRDAKLVEQFSTKGLDFIITDHHEFALDAKDQQIFPAQAKAVVHPKIAGSKYPFTEICGAHVAWKLVCALVKDFALDFDPNQYLDLVALATVCDVMPLISENRIVVQQGLKIMRQSKSLGLKALLQKFAQDLEQLKTYHLGYVIGPRLNASGRMENALDAVRLLTTFDQNYISNLVEKLDQLNLQRQEITRDLIAEAEEQLTASPGQLDKFLYFVYGEGWPEGVVGLVAGKLSEKYHRPVLAASVKQGIVKGSARSIKNFHITEAIATFAQKLDRFGGHAQAAGFTFKQEVLTEFVDGMQQIAFTQLTLEDLEPSTEIDAQLSAEQLSTDLVKQIDKFEPFGYGNKTPTFLIEDLVLQDFRSIGQQAQHLKLKLRYQNNNIDAIGFNMADRVNELRVGSTIAVVGHLDINTWNGFSNLQIKLIDFTIKS